MVTFRTTTAEQVTFSIADILGNTVVSFEPAYFAAGSNQFSFDVLNLPQGQYSLMGKVGEVIIENRVIVKR